MSKETLRIISGKDLTKLLGVNPKDYVSLYPNKGEKDYCPCMDVGLGGCHGMATVMEVLARDGIPGFPEGTRKFTRGKYKSGEVWLDTFYGVAYLYVGKSPSGRYVALTLGGDTPYKGCIEMGHINKGDGDRVFFHRKVFPKK